jgi:hypothetical protein
MDPFDPTSKQLRPLAEYSDRLPSSRRGKKLNRATLWRWALNGLKDGRFIRTVGLGSGRFTCDAWVAAFLSHPRPPAGSPSSRGTPDPVEHARIGSRLGASNGRRTA